MLEVFRRERWNQIHTWEQSIVLIGSILGAKPEALVNVVHGAKKTMLERAMFTYYGADSLIRDLKSKRDALLVDKDMFDRLANMSSG